MNARFWTWDVFDNFTWDHGATVLAAAIGALITGVRREIY